MASDALAAAFCGDANRRDGLLGGVNSAGGKGGARRGAAGRRLRSRPRAPSSASTRTRARTTTSPTGRSMRHARFVPLGRRRGERRRQEQDEATNDGVCRGPGSERVAADAPAARSPRDAVRERGRGGRGHPNRGACGSGPASTRRRRRRRTRRSDDATRRWPSRSPGKSAGRHRRGRRRGSRGGVRQRVRAGGDVHQAKLRRRFFPRRRVR